jgi:hypothetical protein
MLTFALDYELWRLDHDDMVMTFVKKTRSTAAMVATDGLPPPAEEMTIEQHDDYCGWRTVETYSVARDDLIGVRVTRTDDCKMDAEFPTTLVEIYVEMTKNRRECIFRDEVSDDPDYTVRPFWDEAAVLSFVEELVVSIRRLIDGVAAKKVKSGGVAMDRTEVTIKTLVAI